MAQAKKKIPSTYWPRTGEAASQSCHLVSPTVSSLASQPLVPPQWNVKNESVSGHVLEVVAADYV